MSTNRWIGFIVTTAANTTIFTPLSDANQGRRGIRPMSYWEDRWENYPTVGNYGVVDSPVLAAKIVDDLVREGFDLIFAEERK